MRPHYRWIDKFFGWETKYAPNRRQPRLQTLPPPFEPRTTSPSGPAFVVPRRAVVVNGIAAKSASPLLEKIHEGGLEFARFKPGSLTLSFLATHSAAAFVRTHLSEPPRLRAFTGADNAAWEWHPTPPLPAPVVAAINLGARRALAITGPDCRGPKYEGDLTQFGAVEHVWRFTDSRVIVQFYDIADAIQARAQLRANTGLRKWTFNFFPDWCEIDEEDRTRLKLLATHFETIDFKGERVWRMRPREKASASPAGVTLPNPLEAEAENKEPTDTNLAASP